MDGIKVGLQLRTSHGVRQQDLPVTLRTISEMGYRAVAFTDLYDGTPGDLKALCEDLGLEITALHRPYQKWAEDLEGSVAYHRALDAAYAVLPGMGANRCPGGILYEDSREFLARIATKLQEAGIQLLYHNYDHELEPLADGTLKIHRFLENLPGILPAFDTGWIRYAGYDPCECIRAYRGRTPVVYLKDFVGYKPQKLAYALMDSNGDVVEDGTDDRPGLLACPLGQGVQDIPSIIQAGVENGCRTFLVEQNPDDGDDLSAPRQSLEYLRAIGL